MQNHLRGERGENTTRLSRVLRGSAFPFMHPANTAQSVAPTVWNLQMKKQKGAPPARLPSSDGRGRIDLKNLPSRRSCASIRPKWKGTPADAGTVPMARLLAFGETSLSNAPRQRSLHCMLLKSH